MAVERTMQTGRPRLTTIAAAALFGVAADDARDLGSERDQAFLVLSDGRPVAVLEETGDWGSGRVGVVAGTGDEMPLSAERVAEAGGQPQSWPSRLRFLWRVWVVQTTSSAVCAAPKGGPAASSEQRGRDEQAVLGNTPAEQLHQCA
jgi:hypothetical protein